MIAFFFDSSYTLGFSVPRRTQLLALLSKKVLSTNPGVTRQFPFEASNFLSKTINQVFFHRSRLAETII